MKIMNFNEEKMKISHLLKIGIDGNRNKMYRCDCGSFNFSIRKDHKLECSICSKLTEKIWIDKSEIKWREKKH